ncbi:polysaccharide biosynthesis family protein [Ralstonia insidiosa]|uniref:Polysaccharide biosynthesis family protein n=1 Tax=Ralstonia insidiosa TaxID=190721 RepID=A0AAC9BFI8_9RALS|nr:MULTISPECIES: oligosaccharide flippase family protein [Ralstonia]ANH73363.1 polysaccharide biosynthesis family protein [Ralstonia insidiosa]EPX96053.1 lipopolysaccharide biosynthesis protein [Ralstonia sp. AU12-08]MBY4706679.1 oligosaccharide flippase family protein [Ralstonia insidiosa]GAQ27748.1 lipopolysaccharide biosynthesis protein [Ralstonia sp. NT80]
MRVASNLLWMLAERGLQVGGGIAIVAMLARALGPSGFAHFQYAQSIVLIAGSFAFVCGAEVVVPRLVAAPGAATQHRLLAHAFLLRLAGGVAGYLLMCVYLGVTSPGPDVWHAALWLGIAILLREPFGVVIAWMQAHTNNRPNTLFSLTALVVKAILVGSLFATGIHEITGYVAAFALEAMVSAVLLTSYYFIRVPDRDFAWHPPQARELVGAGMLFWGSFILMMCARRVDQLVLQPSVSAVDFGAYAACMQILDNFTMVATILVAGIAPSYIYARTTFADAHARIGRVAFGIGALGLVGGLAIAACAPWIVHLLYGSAFGTTVTLLRIAAAASALVFADVALTLLAVHLRRPRWVTMKWTLVLVTTLVFDLLTIPRLGVWGAIAGYALGNGMAVMVGMALWWRHRPTPGMASA